MDEYTVQPTYKVGSEIITRRAMIASGSSPIASSLNGSNRSRAFHPSAERSAAIVRCLDEADVAHTLEFARRGKRRPPFAAAAMACSVLQPAMAVSLSTLQR
jgi:hypothetical protein